MKITIIGAGNSGLAMAAHLSNEGHEVTLWNRSYKTIEKLIKTKTIYCEGVINGYVHVNNITTDIEKALDECELVMVTTPASAHGDIAKLIAQSSRRPQYILLNPGRTFGVIRFIKKLHEIDKTYEPVVAETQTIIYTCRKIEEDKVHILSLKEGVLLSTLDNSMSKKFIDILPTCIKNYFIPAKSIIETSIGNVGMILHCAPILLNSGWTESIHSTYKYYYDGITPTISKLLEKIDIERVTVSEKLGDKVETTAEWLRRTYSVEGASLYECVQNNRAYEKIDAPKSLNHRYIFEDVPCGLVPLEYVGKLLGVNMEYTTLIIDLANALMNEDFRKDSIKFDLNEIRKYV